MGEFFYHPSDEAFAVRLSQQRAQASSATRASFSPEQLSTISSAASSIRVKYPWLEAGVVASLSLAGYHADDDPTRYAAYTLGLQKLLAAGGKQYSGPDPSLDPLIQHGAEIRAGAAQVRREAHAASLPPGLYGTGPGGPQAGGLYGTGPGQPAAGTGAGQYGTEQTPLAFAGQQLDTLNAVQKSIKTPFLLPSATPGQVEVHNSGQGGPGPISIAAAQAPEGLRLANVIHDVTTSGGPWLLDEVIKPVTRYAFAAASYPFQAAEGSARAAIGSFEHGDVLGGLAQGIEGIPGNPVGLIRAGSDLAAGNVDTAAANVLGIGGERALKQTTLGQAFMGKSLGDGFLPGGAAAEAQSQAAQAAADTIGGHALTPGRFLASTVFAPDTMPFNVASGLVDAAAIIKGDPGALLLKGFGEARAASQTLLPSAEVIAANVAHDVPDAAAAVSNATEAELAHLAQGGEPTLAEHPGFFAKAAGAVHTVMPTFDRQTYGTWAETNPATRLFMNLADDPNATSIWRKLSQRSLFPTVANDGTNIPQALAEATTADEVKQVLGKVLGVTQMDIPKHVGLGYSFSNAGANIGAGRFGFLGNKAIGSTWARLTGELPDAVADPRNPTQFVSSLDRYMANGKVPLALRDEALNRYLANPNSGIYPAIDAAADAVYAQMVANGENPRTARMLSQVFQGAESDGRQYLSHAVLAPTEYNILTAGGEGTTFARSPQLETELLTGPVSLPNVRAIKRATSFARPILEAPGIRNTTQLLDSFNTLWRGGILLRPALTVRILADGFARSAADGLSSPMSHPEDWFHLALGGAIDHPFLQKAAGILPDWSLTRLASARGANVETMLSNANEQARGIADLVEGVRDPEGLVGAASDAEAELYRAAGGDVEKMGRQLYHAKLTGRITSNVGRIRGDITGLPWGMQDEIKSGYLDGMNRVGRGYTPQAQRITLDQWIPASRGAERHAEGILNEIRQMNNSKLMRATTHYTPDQLSAALVDGEFSDIRQKLTYNMPGMADGSPRLQGDVDEYVRSLYDRLSQQTKGDADLIRAVRTGKFGVGDDAPNIQSYLGAPDPDALAAVKARLETNPEFGGDITKVQAQVYLRGDQFSALKGGVVRDTMNKMFSAMLSTPTKRFVASPAWRQMYAERAFPEVWPNIAPEFRAEALQNMRDLGYGDDLVKRLERTPSVVDSIAHPHALTLEQADYAAKMNTHQDFTDLVHDLTVKGQAADSLRLVFPFLEAWQQILSKWARVMVNNPQAPYRLAQGYMAARNAGIIYPDASTGESVFGIPGTSDLSNLFGFGAPVPLQGKVSGLNLVSEGIPGVGWAVKIPMAAILAHTPSLAAATGTVPVTDWLSKTLFPYGNPAEAGSPEGSLMSTLEQAGPVPSSVLRFLNTFMHSPETYRDMASLTARVMQYKASTGQYRLGGADPTAETNRLVNDSKSGAMWLNTVRAIAGFFTPTQLVPNYRVEVKKANGSSNLVTTQLLANDYRAMLANNQGDHTAALTDYIKKYGADNMLAIQPVSVATKGFMPATNEALSWLEHNPSVRDSAPQVFGYFAPQNPKNQFDINAFDLQFGRSERTMQTPEQIVAGSNARIASFLYDKNTKNLTNSKADKQWASDYRAALMHDYPGYNVAAYDYKRIPSLANNIRGALKDSTLAKTDAGIAAAKFFEQYDPVLAAAKAHGLKSINNKFSTKDATFLFEYGKALVEDYPDFAPMFDQVFSHLLPAAARQ